MMNPRERRLSLWSNATCAMPLCEALPSRRGLRFSKDVCCTAYVGLWHEPAVRRDATSRPLLKVLRTIWPATSVPPPLTQRRSQPSDGRITQNRTPLLGPTCLGAQTWAPPSGATPRSSALAENGVTGLTAYTLALRRADDLEAGAIVPRDQLRNEAAYGMRAVIRRHVRDPQLLR